MQKNEIIHSIRETARQVMPSGSRVILFGSQIGRASCRERV